MHPFLPAVCNRAVHAIYGAQPVEAFGETLDAVRAGAAG